MSYSWEDKKDQQMWRQVIENYSLRMKLEDLQNTEINQLYKHNGSLTERTV